MGELSLKIGKKGELKAQEYLLNKSIKIVDTNVHSRYGEIDIIALTKNNILLFIEVKTAKSNSMVHPLEMIHRKKQQNLIKTAKFYLYKNKITDLQSRFDAIIIYGKDITHIENIIQL